jgi:UDP:flavonoid glycosyltransferase YjiC (YdhE family)
MGLGHLTRLMAIGRWLRRLLNALDLTCHPFFLSCSDADFLLARQGFPSFKLPSRTALRNADIRDQQAVELIRAYAEAALERVKPDILLADTFPTGTYDELLPILGREDLCKVFIFREQRSEYASRMPYDKLLSSFDLMLVPHAEGSFEIPFEIPETLSVVWTDCIIFGERHELLSKEKVRSALGLPRNKTMVYAAAGGGGDRQTGHTLELIADTVAAFPELHLVAGAGPLFSGSPLHRDNLTWTNHYPISRFFGAFDFAISSSGYNTVHELQHFGLPAILFSQERGADDQLARALEVEERGAAIALPQLSRETLAEAIERMLDPAFRRTMSETAQSLVAGNGARTAAQAIIDVAIPRIAPESLLGLGQSPKEQ